TSLQAYSKEHNFTIAETIDTNKTEIQMQNDSESKDNTSQANDFKIIYPVIELSKANSKSNVTSPTITTYRTIRAQNEIERLGFYYVGKMKRFNKELYHDLETRMDISEDLMLLIHNRPYRIYQMPDSYELESSDNYSVFKDKFDVTIKIPIILNDTKQTAIREKLALKDFTMLTLEEI